MGYTFVLTSIAIGFLFGYLLGRRDRKNQILQAVIKDKITELKRRNENANVKEKDTGRV